MEKLLAIPLLLLTSAIPAQAATAAGEWDGTVPGIFWFALIAPAIALLFAWYFYASMMKESEGTDRMKEIAGHVKEGARTYLKVQYAVVAVFFLVMMVVLAILAYVFNLQAQWVPFAFLTGGFFSGLCGWLGMITATEASARTTHASRSGLNQGLRIAFRSGGVMGLIVVGLGLLDIAGWFAVLTQTPKFSLFGFLPLGMTDLHKVTVTMLAFEMGASSMALFARVGGGIYTKAADVGADLVGKVEEGIPEDDPRNPGTIADNVGDNVGDVAGMGADLYESYCGAILATMVLGVSAKLGVEGVIAPMLIAAVGIILSIVGIYMVRTEEDATHAELLDNLMFGINTSSFLIGVSGLGVFYLLFFGQPVHSALTGVFGETYGFMDLIRLWSPIGVGILAGVVIGYVTGYYTSDSYQPTRDVAAHAQTGPATVIIDGVAVGMLSSGWTMGLVVIGVILAFAFPGGFSYVPLGLYGVGIGAVGLLSTLGITLSTDAFGPIADNAGGNAEMSELEPEVRERTDLLDSLGNTTAATGKGFAIGSAALTALALLAAYIEEVKGTVVKLEQDAAWKIGETTVAVSEVSITQFLDFFNVTIMNPRVLAGIMLGGMTVFVFCALTMKAVGRAAGEMIEEIRKQFRENPDIMKGEAKPDYTGPIAISTRSAQKEMIMPTLLAVAVPIATSIFLGIAGIMGLLAGTVTTGFLVAIMMANSGGAWDNAKKYIETGEFGGKGSEAHKASVVGDTVGDPFKDTAGPSLNILVKLMSIVSVVFAGAAYKWGDLGIVEILNLDWPV